MGGRHSRCPCFLGLQDTTWYHSLLVNSSFSRKKGWIERRSDSSSHFQSWKKVIFEIQKGFQSIKDMCMFKDICICLFQLQVDWQLIERRKRDIGIHKQKLLDYRPASCRKLHSMLLSYPLHLLMWNLSVEKKTCFKSLKNKYMAIAEDAMWDLEEYWHMTWIPEIL